MTLPPLDLGSGGTGRTSSGHPGQGGSRRGNDSSRGAPDLEAWANYRHVRPAPPPPTTRGRGSGLPPLGSSNSFGQSQREDRYGSYAPDPFARRPSLDPNSFPAVSGLSATRPSQLSSLPSPFDSSFSSGGSGSGNFSSLPLLSSLPPLPPLGGGGSGSGLGSGRGRDNSSGRERRGGGGDTYGQLPPLSGETRRRRPGSMSLGGLDGDFSGGLESSTTGFSPLPPLGSNGLGRSPRSFPRLADDDDNHMTGTGPPSRLPSNLDFPSYGNFDPPRPGQDSFDTTAQPMRRLRRTSSIQSGEYPDTLRSLASGNALVSQSPAGMASTRRAEARARRRESGEHSDEDFSDGEAAPRPAPYRGTLADSGFGLANLSLNTNDTRRHGLAPLPPLSLDSGLSGDGGTDRRGRPSGMRDRRDAFPERSTDSKSSGRLLAANSGAGEPDPSPLRLPSPYEPPLGARGSNFTLPPLSAPLRRNDSGNSSRGPPLSPPPTAPLPPLPSLSGGSAIPFSRHPGRTIGMATTPEGYPDIFGQYSFPTEPGGHRIREHMLEFADGEYIVRIRQNAIARRLERERQQQERERQQGNQS